MKSTDRPGRPTDRLGPARYGMGAHFPPSGDQSSRPDKVAAGYCWPDGRGRDPGLVATGTNSIDSSCVNRFSRFLRPCTHRAATLVEVNGRNQKQKNQIIKRQQL